MLVSALENWDLGCTSPKPTAVDAEHPRVPEGVDDAKSPQRLLDEYGIEILEARSVGRKFSASG